MLFTFCYVLLFIKPGPEKQENWTLQAGLEQEGSHNKMTNMLESFSLSDL